MKFENSLQHNPQHFDQLGKITPQGGLTQHDALLLCEVFTAHVHPRALAIAKLLDVPEAEPYIREASRQYAAAYEAMRPLHQIETLTQQLVDIFYGTEGVLLLKKPQTTKLLVIWTSVFNNFFVSNVVLAKLIGKLDCSLLFLKDDTLYRYSRGVKGFAGSADELGPAIEKVARDHELEEIYHMAAADAGYPALRTSLQSRCDGYLAFSQTTDLSADSPLAAPALMTPEVRAAVGSDFLEDLKPRLREADPAVARMLYYGELDPRDAEHARHLEDIGTVRTAGIPGVKHNTVFPLIADGTFVPVVEKLLSGK